MHAIRIHKPGGNEVLQYETDVPMPQIAEDEVLIRVEYASINPADVFVRSYGGRGLSLPAVPLTDGSGTIEKVGSAVTQFKVGDRVFSVSGGKCAQFCASPANRCWTLPENLTFAQGAAIPVPYFTAYRALFHKCQAKAGSTVLVHGASGAVGLAAVQLAKAANITVIGTAGTDAGLKLVKQNGATHVVNHNDSDHFKTIMTLTENKGVDAIVEMKAESNLAEDLKILREHGTVCGVGIKSPGKVEIGPGMLIAKELRILGVMLFKSSEAEWKEMGGGIQAGLISGDLIPIIDREYSLEDTALAYTDIIEKNGSKGNLVIKVSK